MKKKNSEEWKKDIITLLNITRKILTAIINNQ